MSPTLFFGLLVLPLTVAKLAWIWRGSMKKDGRATIDPIPWAIWGTLNGITLMSQLSEGWGWSLLLLTANTTGNFVVVAFAYWHDRKPLTSNDYGTLGIASVVVILWMVLQAKDASYGLVFCILADAVGVARIYVKAARDPWCELVGTWVFSALASVSALISALCIDGGWMAWIYPLYASLNALGSVGIIHACRWRDRRRPVLNTSPVPVREVA